MSRPGDGGTTHTPPPPPPSLLTTLLAGGLDPGYAAARARGGRPAGRRWTVIGALVTGVVMGAAVAASVAAAPAGDAVRTSLASEVRQAQDADDELGARRLELERRADELRSASLTGDDTGRDALDGLERLRTLAAATPVAGPGLRATVTDTALDAAEGGDGASAGSVLDRDLQAVVNGLWASGAEAVAIGGVRLSPGSTIRSAGGAMLVDNRPVASPYVVEAIGRPTRMETSFVSSEGFLRMSALVQVYDVGFDVVAADELVMAGAPLTDLRWAAPR